MIEKLDLNVIDDNQKIGNLMLAKKINQLVEEVNRLTKDREDNQHFFSELAKKME